MFLDGLDDVDQKIVSLLIQNARMSYSEIGQQIGLSRVAVKMRVQALEQKGIIEEYTTVINPQKISGAVSCYFEIETKPDMLMEVAGILEKNDTVTQGQVIGKSGTNTIDQDMGNHLHFELYKSGEIVDPSKYFDQVITSEATKDTEKNSATTDENTTTEEAKEETE